MTIEKYLQTNGPTLTSKLKQYYLEKDDASDDAIRKRISRATVNTKKISGFFKDNQSLLFTVDDYQNVEIRLNSLYNALRTDAKTHFSILHALAFHNGFLKKEVLANYSYSPVENLKTHKSFLTVITELKKHQLIIEDEFYYSLNPVIETSESHNLQRYLALDIAKNFIMNQFYDLVRNIGMISYDKGMFNKEVFKLQFSFTAPSYIKGIVDVNPNNPSFLFADILLGNNIDNHAVDFFIKKVDIIKNTSSNKFLPYLIVDNVNSETLKLLKENGIIIGFVDKLFGPKYSEFLKTLISTVENAGAILKTNPDAYISLIDQLHKLVDGKTNNLRGDLFELAVGYYYSKECQSLNIGRMITLQSTGEKKEIDVEASFSNKQVFCECKAYKQPVPKGEVEEWLSKKVPIIYKYFLEKNSDDKKAVFEFWSVSGFTEDALIFLDEKKSRTKRYEINFYSKEEILKKARESKAHKITEIMRDYFKGDV